MSRDAISRWTLKRLPARVLQFLTALGRYPEIRAHLEARGYTDEEHQLGWSLLHAASHYKPAPSAPPAASDPVVTSAITTLDNWDEPNFASIAAILRRFFPDVAEYVFAGLEPAKGAGAVMSVKRLLGRVQALQNGEERAATRKQDHAALALLAKRGYPKEEWARLAALVETAEKGAKPDAALVEKAEEAASAEAAGEEAEPAFTPQEEQSLMELHAWFDDWSTVARNHITRRRWHIALGLAAPRKKKAKKEKTDDGTK